MATTRWATAASESPPKSCICVSPRAAPPMVCGGRHDRLRPMTVYEGLKSFALLPASLFPALFLALLVTWVEDRAANTAENATYSAAILKNAGVSSVVLVTDAYHMPRALALFRATGLATIPAPTEFPNLHGSSPTAFIPRMSALEESHI